MRKIGMLSWLIVMHFVAYGQQPIAATNYGKVMGYAEGQLHVFKSIPFAAPPVGALRWQPPQPPHPWQGIKQCTAFSASPLQPPPVPFLMWTEEFIAPPSPLSEDCLYLNVWTPSLDPAARLPVFVWIYGGGFTSGAAACAIYDGAAYAKKGVVFVSLNYRVGVFGFLAHPALSQSSPFGVSGNYGLLDQIAALRWIRDNISAFGGDPSNVTIAGQSAGAMSVNCLVASPLAKGLFHKAIAQSGGLLSGRFTSTLNDGEQRGLQFQQRAGAADLEQLRSMDADSLVRVAMKMGGLRFGPLLDGAVLPHDLNKAFAQGQFNDVPLLGGWVTGDGALMATPTLTSQQFVHSIQGLYGTASDAILALLPHASASEVASSQQQLNLLSFAIGGMHRWATHSKQPVFMYEFSHVPPDKPGFPNYGAFHTAEVPYALGNLDTWKRNWQPDDRVLEEQMSSYWLQFIRTGDPNKQGLPAWPPYTPRDMRIMHLDEHLESKPGTYASLLQLVDGW